MYHFIIGFLLLFSFYYVQNIASHFMKLKRLNNLLCKIIPVLKNIHEKIDDGAPSGSFILNPKLREHQIHEVRELIPLMDKIDEFVTVWDFNSNNRLEYSNSNFNNLDNAKEICNLLLSKRDTLLNRRLQTFNPKFALKSTFLTPSIILKYFGIDLSNIPSRIFSVVIWILLRYSSVIENIIIELIKNIFDA